MISETRERFLRAIVAKVPAAQIVEIHFFQPIKQGGVESGVAVIAADDAAAALPPGAELHGGADEGTLATTAAPEPHETAAVEPPREEPATEDAAEGTELGEAEDVEAASEAVDGEEPAPHERGAAIAAPARGEASLVSDEIPTESALDDLVSGEDWDDVGGDEPEDAEERPARFTVYTARYRLVLKGIDRGKWESAVVAEADAPLLTVETVVRGVQRRSGDVEDPTRMTGAEVRTEIARMEAAAEAKMRGGARALL